MKVIYMMDIVSWICIICLFVGFATLFYVVIDDQMDKEQECTDEGGEITSGKTSGCLIDGSLYEMTRTKKGWIILEINDSFEVQHE